MNYSILLFLHIQLGIDAFKIRLVLLLRNSVPYLIVLRYNIEGAIAELPPAPSNCVA